MTEDYERVAREIEEQLARAEEVPCVYGNCIEWHDPETGENLGGFGPMGCPCQADEEAE